MSLTQSAQNRIERIREKLGNELTIVGHHYQTEEVIRHADLRGDSLELARKTAESHSRYIMFCGVYFMAESAALLAKQGQEIHIPVPGADCSMAQMAAAEDVRNTLTWFRDRGRKIVPLAYVNSTLPVKAVVGEFGGSVCTSANAKTMLEWAFAQGDAVLFLPDMNLGLNTAQTMGFAESDCQVLTAPGTPSWLHSEVENTARLLLWPGYCSIHTFFTVDMVKNQRASHPGAKVIVHPESRPEIVAASDSAGSTSFIIRYANELPDGETLIIGTEINLVERLARQHQGRITILPLAPSACSFMGETTENILAEALEEMERCMESGGRSPYHVVAPENLKDYAKAALDRMLKACA
ncbi:quinolinate synthase NadA [Desulfovibrio sp. OttesenSCG-928-G15]|nr:quinolinate synthase NadA [Desulfovibrio sp. OttesenSCG-928-G15]